MELTWPIKIRIFAALMVGVVLLGVLGWQMVAPQEPMGVVAMRNGDLSIVDIIVCVALALLAGFISYFLCKPFGLQLAILAAPGGMAIWAIRTGSMTSLLQVDAYSVEFRRSVYSSLRWEALLWLVIVAAGFIGVQIADKLTHRGTDREPSRKNGKTKSFFISYLSVVSILASALIAWFCIGIFAQDVSYFDVKFGQVASQPAVGQIAFAVVVSFAVSAFLLKFFLNSSYVWIAISTVLLNSYIMVTSGKTEVLTHMSASWPAAFFAYPGAAILPVQMVAFGSIGAVAGYWAASRYKYWRKHEK